MATFFKKVKWKRRGKPKEENIRGSILFRFMKICRLNELCLFSAREREGESVRASKLSQLKMAAG